MPNPPNNPRHSGSPGAGASGRSAQRGASAGPEEHGPSARAEPRDAASVKQREQDGAAISLREKTREALQKAETVASEQIDRAAEQMSEVSDALGLRPATCRHRPPAWSGLLTD